MGFNVTESIARNASPPSKNCIRDFSEVSPVCLGTFASQSIALYPVTYSTSTIIVSGVHENTLRYFDPELGRWLSRDAIGEDGGVNLYIFVDNNPIDFGDAFGLSKRISELLAGLQGWQRLRHPIVWALYPFASRQISPGVPQKLLLHYMMGSGEEVVFSPSEFVTLIRPQASIYRPTNKRVQAPEALRADLQTKCPGCFEGDYEFGGFDMGNQRGGGLGYFVMKAHVKVTCSSATAWSLEGESEFVKEPWDFNWKWADVWAFIRSQWNTGGNPDSDRGRTPRTVLGSQLPGKAFDVSVDGKMKVTERDSSTWATFTTP